MEKEKIIKVTVGGAQYAYPYGTSYRKIAADFQERFSCDILLVKQDGALRELHHVLKRECVLEMVTAQDVPGIQTYERSAVFLMLKAFYDVVGRQDVERISIEYSLSRSIFVLAQGNFTLDQALLDRIEERMRELSAQALPIEKQSIRVDEAMELFRQAGMLHKAQLLSFRLDSHVNVYSLDGFVDYFYGYMVPDTGYIRCFGLELFEDGFVLRLPTLKNPNQLGGFHPSKKIFRELHESSRRSQALNASNVAELNTTVAQGGATPLILTYEAMMEKKIGDIAAEIAGRRQVRFVMIAGPSSSGKTTFSHRLSTQLRACGLRPHAIATDNYFKNRVDTPLDENGQYDFECLGAMDVEQFNTDMVRLLHGETVELPSYNFKKGVREYNGTYLTLEEGDVLVIEGIHCLNDQFTHSDRKSTRLNSSH